MNEKIVCCIFNYKDDEKAKRWYLGLKDSFDTYLFDTFHKDNGDSEQAFLDLQPSDHIKFFNNIYFGGQYFEAYKLCVEKHARWMVTITSDLEIDDENLEKLKSIMSDEIYDSLDIGIYQPSAKEGSSCFGTCKVWEKNSYLFNNHTGGLRDIEGGEDWFFMTRMSETHDAFSLYQTGNYQLGWGIGYCFSIESQFDGFRNVIDDRVEVFHPFGSNYDTKEAERQYTELQNRLYASHYHFTTTGIDKYFFKNPLDKDKYLVLTCAKNEDKYLVEFVEHYLNLGFDKVIIADNNDKPTIYHVLDKYISEGTVEIWNCRGFGSFQVQLYAMFANEGNYKWCGYFDADEFLEIGCYSNIKDYLATIKENSVSFNWINFGSNGEKHYREGNLSERFKKPVAPIIYFKENAFIKSIVRGGDCWKGCWFNGSHIPFIRREGYPDRTGAETYNIGGYFTTHSYYHFQAPFRYKQGYIKHYYTKSFDEWMVKANRGWPDGTNNLKASVFFGYETKPDFDFDKFIHAAFGQESDYYANMYEKSEFHKQILDDYSVIQIDTTFLYSIYIEAICLMKCTTNHTFIFNDDQVDDSLFTLLLECAFYTGNRVVCARDKNEVWNAFLKYRNKNESTYYIVYLS